MCRSLHCAYLLAHHTPVGDKGNPYGPNVGCVLGSLAPTAVYQKHGLAWGGEVWRLPSRVYLFASATGGWGSIVDD